MTTWHHEFLQQLPMLPMQQLETHFGLSGFTAWPNAQGLNDLNRLSGNLHHANFVCQSQLSESDSYYEQIIYQQHIIPTRPNNWHDLFNGLVWLQFPQTKGLLNQLHVKDIQQYGLSPRTHRRNNLTHFDECGVILTYQRGSGAEQQIKDLAMHRWQSVFIENRPIWGKELNSFMFGHANLEMLLQPFVGLTGKWLALEVDKQFSSKSYSEQLKQIDELLVIDVKQGDIFAKKKSLYPIPLLGIPDVWDANKHPEFYTNTDYFRPTPRLKND